MSIGLLILWLRMAIFFLFWSFLVTITIYSIRLLSHLNYPKDQRLKKKDFNLQKKRGMHL